MSLEDEAKEHFLFFAKFEYALKHSGCVYPEGREKIAKPDWKTFTQGIELNIDWNDPDIKKLAQDPPRKQIYDGMTVKDAPRGRPLSSDAELIDACRTIRNNLFHGEKCNDADRERNRMLLRASRKILDAALEARPTVKAVFGEAEL